MSSTATEYPRMSLDIPKLNPNPKPKTLIWTFKDILGYSVAVLVDNWSPSAGN